MSDEFETRLKALLAASPPEPRDAGFEARVMRRVAGIKRLRFAGYVAAVAGVGALAVLLTPAAMRAAESVNAVVAALGGTLDPLLVSPVGYALGVLAACAVLLHVATD
jgi:hypothetical protein